MSTTAPRRILGMDRELLLWILVIIALIVIGYLLDLYLGYT